MKSIFTIICVVLSLSVFAQRNVTEEVLLENQDELILDLAIADEITVITWDEKRIKVVASVSLNEGEDNHMYELEKRSSERTITFRHDKEIFKNINRKHRCWESEIYYTVYMPENMVLDINTISADLVLENVYKKAYLKTISGDIDITVTGGLEFKAKTISGEVYSDLDITYPEGISGLKQVVGMNIRGIIGGGGDRYDLETISGSIFLRKG